MYPGQCYVQEAADCMHCKPSIVLICWKGTQHAFDLHSSNFVDDQICLCLMQAVVTASLQAGVHFGRQG